MSLQDSVAQRRRNGREQACEPCRKRKTACDHTLPVCRRCKHRKVSKDCVYLVAPMTRSSAAATLDTPTSSSSLPILNPPPKPIRERTPDLDSRLESIPSPASLFSGPTTYLGATSFSAVFLENRTNLEQYDTAQQMHASEGDIGHSRLIKDKNALDSDLVRLGIKVLTQVPSEDVGTTLLSRHVNPNDAFVRLAAGHILKSIWSTYGKYLNKQSTKELENISQHICRNATSMLSEEDEPTMWLNSFSGSNLRWEALGMLFTYWAYGATASPENDPIFASQHGPPKTRRQYMIEMKECASSCIALCSHADYANTLVVYLLYKHNLLQSIITGDSSLILWRQHADLVSVTTSLGLHRDPERDSCQVSLPSQIRRMLYAAVFTIDKVLSTFVGRPPMLGRRYSTTPLPLDIGDEDWLSGQATVAKAAASLDADGWNTHDRIYSTTVLRARTKIAFIRDEVLEIALGPTTENSTACALSLKQKSNSLYAEFPGVIVLDHRDLSNPQITIRIIYARILVRMEHLQNVFFLERLLIKHRVVNGQELLDISRELLSLVLVYWKQRDRFTALHHDYEWMMMYYGVPPSGVICVELLKQTKDTTDRSFLLPRSETIQNLTMFTEFLDWVKPSAPNADLCFRIRKIIGRVLDQVLDPPVFQPPSADLQTSYDFEFPLGSLDFNDFSNFDLLDTFDWVNPTSS